METAMDSMMQYDTPNLPDVPSPISDERTPIERDISISSHITKISVYIKSIQFIDLRFSSATILIFAKDKW